MEDLPTMRLLQRILILHSSPYSLNFHLHRCGGICLRKKRSLSEKAKRQFHFEDKCGREEIIIHTKI